MINFYDSLRYEVNDGVGITLATHGWIGGDMSRGKFMLEEGSEMQWREEKEVRYMLKLFNKRTLFQGNKFNPL